MNCQQEKQKVNIKVFFLYKQNFETHVSDVALNYCDSLFLIRDSCDFINNKCDLHSARFIILSQQVSC
jgi:hypothetical protein